MKTLYEGLLDDNIFNDIDKAIATDWLKANVKSQYKIMQLKTGELKVWGKLIIKDIDEIGWLNIASLEGDLYIENCGIIDLNRIFAEYAKVKGNINITGCKKLIDISGLPYMVDGNVTITNCPALKELTGVNCLAGEVSVMRCGKRFKQAAVQKAFPAAIAVFCSEEDYEANVNEAFINESFQDPVLIRLYEQIRDAKKKFKLDAMFGAQTRMDRITPSMRTTFRHSEEKKMLTAARKILANTNRDNGFIATEDYDGKFCMFFNNQQAIYWLQEGGFPDSWNNSDYQDIGNVNDLLDKLKSTSSYMIHIKYVHIWNITSDRWEIQQDRRRSREGMVDVRDKGLMMKLLRDQQDKYRRSVKALKAARNSDQYKAVVAKVNGIMERFTKFMNKLIADPSWAASISYKAGLVFDAIRKGYERGASYQEYGVIYEFQRWSGEIIRTLSKDSTYGSINDSDLLKAIDRADKRLKEVGL